MPCINLLPEDLINKIAAGEVIERPASVVKELIENSLDAEAASITVEIEDSGKKLIKVSDNGVGMDKADAQSSVLRHATSKIREEKDLLAITSLGFRGEALASIAAVSQLSLITKQKGALEGFNLIIEGGKTISSGIMAAEEGTTIEVRSLFFNTPARKKFLKSDQVELRHIIDVVLRYALINQEVSFALIHDSHNLVNSPGVDDWRSKIASIYGTKLARELLEVSYQSESVKLSGYIAPPSQARNDKNQQFLFINRRWVRNNEIINAIYDAFHSLLFIDKHPVLILNLELDPKEIDVNVHPAKTEVKIEQKELVCSAVFTAVKETLEKNRLIPVLGLEREKQVTFGAPGIRVEERKEEKAEARYSFELGRQAFFPAKAGLVAGGKEAPEKAGIRREGRGEEEEIGEEGEMKAAEPVLSGPEAIVFTADSRKIPPMKLLGQIHRTFFAAEAEDGLFLLDQHAVHERILYEKFKEEYLNRSLAVQTLLRGDILEFSPAESSAVAEFKERLNEFGFRLEEFGDNTYIVKTIPALLDKIQPKEIVYEILARLDEGKSRPEEIQEEIIARMACRSAVMAGDELTLSQMENYLKELSETKQPWTCPHGRPTMFKISVDELERKFKRKG